MDIISAYQQLGSYRAAADLCGTTHKTVKRVVEKFEADRPGRRRRAAGGAVQAGERPTRLAHQDVEGREIPYRYLRLGGDVGRALGHQAIGQEVAVDHWRCL